MILGMSTATYTLLHVLISLAGIGSGLVVLYGLITGKRLNGWTAVFLTTTALTSISGFGYLFHMEGSWRSVYVIGSALALYLNVFVLVVQSFMKVPALKALAPTQKEPPFLVAQLAVSLAFIWLTILAAKRFRIGTARAAASGTSLS